MSGAEGIAAIGVVTSLVQLISLTQKLVYISNELRGKSSRADRTLLAIEAECMTMQTVLGRVKDWIEKNQTYVGHSTHIRGLTDAFNILTTAIKALVDDLTNIKSGFRARVSFLWSDEKQNLLLEEIRWQATAVHLLLSALQL